MANRDGSLGQTYVDYLAERARGGAGLIVVESTYVDARGMGDPFQVGCHGDHVIPGLRAAADAVHAEGGKLALELYFAGRVVTPRVSQRQPLGPSPVACELHDPVPSVREMTRAEIAGITQAFADAAQRVLTAGVDMIHLHGAHGYLLCAFLSPRTNLRSDEYGGSLENRARFALDVLAAVRDVVGPDFPIGYRLSADEYVEGGLTVEETAPFAAWLAAAGVDLIDVAGGSYESVTKISQSALSPEGGFVRDARLIKAAVGDRAPVSVAQRLNDPDFANEVMSGGIDFITLSRAFHADPHYAAKLSEGRPEDIVPCIACQTCSDLLAESRLVRCAVNPASGLERRRRLPAAARARHVVVVGGGPAGLQAARILAEQRHSVVLYEQAASLGGQVRYAARVTEDFANLVAYLARQLEKLEVDVRLGVAADLAAIERDGADAVVLATGATGGHWFCPLEGSPRTFDVFGAFDLPDDGWAAGGDAAIVGGDGGSCFLALHIAERGGIVHVIEPRRQFAFDRGGASRMAILEALASRKNIHLHAETTAERVGDGWVDLQSGGRHTRLDGVGTPVIGGRTSSNALQAELVAARPELEVRVIGDAVEPRDVFASSHDAADAAELIHLRAVA